MPGRRPNLAHDVSQRASSLPPGGPFMSVHFRVYPQYGAQGGIGGYGANAMAFTENALLKAKLAAQQAQDAMQLKYERALWGQQLQMTQLKTQAQYGYGSYGGYGGLGGVSP